MKDPRVNISLNTDIYPSQQDPESFSPYWIYLSSVKEQT